VMPYRGSDESASPHAVADPPDHKREIVIDMGESYSGLAGLLPMAVVCRKKAAFSCFGISCTG
jgi:hypothetical protein